MICGCIFAAWFAKMGNPSDKKEQTGNRLPVCLQCGRPLVPDEVALTRKMINRGASSFFCLSCLAARFEVTEEALRQKIREFREMGCTLFRPFPPCP